MVTTIHFDTAENELLEVDNVMVSFSDFDEAVTNKIRVNLGSWTPAARGGVREARNPDHRRGGGQPLPVRARAAAEPWPLRFGQKLRTSVALAIF